jgi:hypothetical protein
METFADSIGRLYWQVSSIFDFALTNWTITFVALLLMIRWAGNERRRSARV